MGWTLTRVLFGVGVCAVRMMGMASAVEVVVVVVVVVGRLRRKERCVAERSFAWRGDFR